MVLRFLPVRPRYATTYSHKTKGEKKRGTRRMDAPWHQLRAAYRTQPVHSICTYRIIWYNNDDNILLANHRKFIGTYRQCEPADIYLSLSLSPDLAAMFLLCVCVRAQFVQVGRRRLPMAGATWLSQRCWFRWPAYKYPEERALQMPRQRPRFLLC